jgi:hypothetical protein
MYAETQARMVINNRESVIKRKLYCSADGVKAVYSDIETTTDISGYKTTGRRTLSEYLIGDSLFIFDSDDSSCMVGTISDFSEANFDFFPLSAAWLLNTKGNDAKPLESDTMTIGGLICRKELLADGSLWKHDNQPMARRANTKNVSYNERVMYCVSDTGFDAKIFMFPIGYSRIVPSN